MGLALVDEVTGEKFDVFPMSDSSRHRAKQKVEAYVKYLMTEKPPGYFYCVGTNWKLGEFDRFNKAVQKLGRLFKKTYIMVVETGTSGYCHVHIIAEEMWYKRELIKEWESITGIQGAHCNSKNLYGGEEGAEKTGRYLAKYCAKDEGWPGIRKIRSSKGLTKLIAKYMKPKQGSVMLLTNLPKYEDSNIIDEHWNEWSGEGGEDW